MGWARELIDYCGSGGAAINAALFVVAVVVFSVGLGKILSFRRIRAVGHHCPRYEASRCAFCFLQDESLCQAHCAPAVYRNIFRERLLEVVPRLEAGLDTMASLIQVAPLLGLVGTVIGMIRTFTLITRYGTANPVILTEGITVSLLTTQAGLLVAFPCLLLHNYVVAQKDRLIQDILMQGEAMVVRMSNGQRGQ